MRFGAHEWTDAEVNTAHAISVAELGSGRWETVDPWSGPRECALWLAVLLAASEGLAIEEALGKVFALPLAELLASLETR